MIDANRKHQALVVDGVYENGVIRPDGPLPLKDCERVRVTVEPAVSWVDRTAGIVPWSGSVADLESIATDAEFDP